MIALSTLAICVLVLNTLFDITYVLNNLLIFLYSTCSRILFPPKQRCAFLEENVMYSICLTTDLDFLMHMNNARYLRECDMARIKFWIQNDLLNTLQKAGGSIALSVATSIRYRKQITLFTIYSIKTKMVYWDGKAVYIQHKFVRLSDGFVLCEVLSKQLLLGTTADQIVEVLGYPITKPPCPENLEKWIECNDISSAKLKQKSG